MHHQRVPSSAVIVPATGEVGKPQPPVERQRRIVVVFHLEQHPPPVSSGRPGDSGLDQSPADAPSALVGGDHDTMQIGRVGDQLEGRNAEQPLRRSSL